MVILKPRCFQELPSATANHTSDTISDILCSESTSQSLTLMCSSVVSQTPFLDFSFLNEDVPFPLTGPDFFVSQAASPR